MSFPLRQVEHQHKPAAIQDPYRYQPLATPQTFRLLRLHAGSSSTITCSLVHHILNSAQCPHYRALSYTWGKDDARFDIHIDDRYIFKVRENLRNALRSVRDAESDCWLWIDAICINQNSNAERDQQVKLMAEIYSSANVVLVWLQSANEKVDGMAAAFRFVHAAATATHASSRDSEPSSVSRYIREHSHDSKRNWSALRRLCQLRYWTRKWIIQELILARTVVLQVGGSTCSMSDLETFCREIQEDQDRGGDLNSGGGEDSSTQAGLDQTLDLILASPAARLALQRAETNNADGDRQQQPHLLHDLVERYAENQCQEPRDHVYALYSLVGPHRTHLRIDHAASPVERLVSVLHFVHHHEHLPPSKSLSFANLLAKLFKIPANELHRHRRRSLLTTLHLTLPFTTLGHVSPLPESQISLALRGMVEPLPPIPIFALDTTRPLWNLSGREDPVAQAVGRPDMTSFSVTGTRFFGLAACRLEEEDLIFHLVGTQMVFAVRRDDDGGEARIVGRAYLFLLPNSGVPKFWLENRLDDYAIGKQEVLVSMDLSTLFELKDMAVLIEAGTPMFKLPEAPPSRMEVVRKAGRIPWRHVVVSFSSVASIGLFVALIIFCVKYERLG